MTEKLTNTQIADLKAYVNAVKDGVITKKEMASLPTSVFQMAYQYVENGHAGIFDQVFARLNIINQDNAIDPVLIHTAVYDVNAVKSFKEAVKKSEVDLSDPVSIQFGSAIELADAAKKQVTKEFGQKEVEKIQKTFGVKLDIDENESF